MMNKELTVIKFFRDAARGAGYLPGYGDNPGTGFAIVMLGMLIVAGAANDNLTVFAGVIVGAVGWAVMILPLFLVGCADRAREFDRRQQG